MKYTVLCALAALITVSGCSSNNTTDGGADVATDRGSGGDAALDVPADRPGADAPGVDVALDTPPADEGLDAPADTTADVRADGAGDAVSLDAPADAPVACSPSTPCHPFICACGRCDPSAIICVADSRGCPMACAMSCPELATTVCRCEGGACVRGGGASDGGGAGDGGSAGDSGGASDGGGAGDAGGVGATCSSSDMCGPGLLCCYPCGIPGCMNRCMPPDPSTGRCPLFP